MIKMNIPKTVTCFKKKKDRMKSKVLSVVRVGKLFRVHFVMVLMNLPPSTKTETVLTCLISCYCTS